MKNIFINFPISNEEYQKLADQFTDLCEYAAWQLIKKNSKNNHTDEQEDVSQELKLALVRAGSYYKRQVYIENCLKLVDKYCKNKMTRMVVDELKYLWKNKTRHGANRQKFGPKQEDMLEKLLDIIPEEERPRKDQELKIDTKFKTYCKAITWNAQKAIGRKITKEKSIRSGIVSISEYDYLGSKS